MDLKELKELIRLVSEKGITEFEMEREGIRLRICRSVGNEQAAPPVAVPAPVIVHSPLPVMAQAETGALIAPVAAPSVAPVPQTPPAVEEEPLHVIKSPIVGTFYRSPSPTSDAFVKVGDHVERDTVVCIIEAMKLMNEIQAEIVGEVARIFVENGQPVEYGQPLFGIKA